MTALWCVCCTASRNGGGLQSEHPSRSIPAGLPAAWHGSFERIGGLSLLEHLDSGSKCRLDRSSSCCVFSRSNTWCFSLDARRVQDLSGAGLPGRWNVHAQQSGQVSGRRFGGRGPSRRLYSLPSECFWYLLATDAIFDLNLMSEIWLQDFFRWRLRRRRAIWVYGTRTWPWSGCRITLTNLVATRSRWLWWVTELVEPVSPCTWQPQPLKVRSTFVCRPSRRPMTMDFCRSCSFPPFSVLCTRIRRPRGGFVSQVARVLTIATPFCCRETRAGPLMMTDGGSSSGNNKPLSSSRNACNSSNRWLAVASGGKLIMEHRPYAIYRLLALPRSRG